MNYTADAKWLKEFKRRAFKAAGVRKVAELHRKMSDRFDVGYQTLGRYFKGEREIPLEFLIQLNIITGVSYDLLMPGGSEIDVEGIKRQGVQEFLAKNVGVYAQKDTERPKIRKEGKEDSVPLKTRGAKRR
jgi:transcriptional regulator with XRE-family HTH domain